MPDDLATNLKTLKHELIALGIGTSALKEEAEKAIAAAVPAIVVDLETEIIVGSTYQADRLFGYIEGELLGKEVHDLIPDDKKEIHQNHFLSFKQNPQPKYMGTREMKLTGLRRNKQEFPVEIGLYPRMVNNRRACVAVILDMTDRLKEH